METNKSVKCIVLVGGGSGGHLTPLVAVAQALKDKSTDTKIVYIGQTGESLHDIMQTHVIDEFYTISAGKFRRYHRTHWLRQVFDFKTLALNIRDFYRFMKGKRESRKLLVKLKPDVIFLKGGFVSVPVGFAARKLRIPYITHDSDVVPGLANRLTARHAMLNTVAQEASQYPYPTEKIKQVGIPLQKEYRFVTPELKKQARIKLNIPADSRVIVSVGGGLGAQRINIAMVEASAMLLKESDVYIIHFTGKKLYSDTVEAYKKKGINSDRLKVVDFTTELFNYTAAADLVVTRAGATNLAELSLQGKACVVIPSPYLTGGQQLHNARLISKNDSAVVIQEEDLDRLSEELILLISNPEKISYYESQLHSLSISDGANRIATILLEIATKTNEKTKL